MRASLFIYFQITWQIYKLILKHFCLLNHNLGDDSIPLSNPTGGDS